MVMLINREDISSQNGYILPTETSTCFHHGWNRFPHRWCRDVVLGSFSASESADNLVAADVDEIQVLVIPGAREIRRRRLGFMGKPVALARQGQRTVMWPHEADPVIARWEEPRVGKGGGRTGRDWG